MGGSGACAVFITLIAVYDVAARGGESLSPSPSLSPTRQNPSSVRPLYIGEGVWMGGEEGRSGWGGRAAKREEGGGEQ